LTFTLEDDELVGNHWRTQEIKKMLEDPEPEEEYLDYFLFLTSDDQAKSRCALPYHPYFSNRDALSAARGRLKEFRQKSYCPLHRHSVLVDFVETLSKLLGGKLDECMKYVNLRRANAAANSLVYVPEDPSRTALNYRFEKYIVETAKAINEGLMQCDEDTDVDEEDVYGKQFKYWECKGKSCVHTSLFSWTRP